MAGLHSGADLGHHAEYLGRFVGVHVHRPAECHKSFFHIELEDGLQKRSRYRVVNTPATVCIVIGAVRMFV